MALVVQEIADDGLIGPLQIVRIHKDVECRLSRWAVGVRGSIHVHIHAVGQHFKRRMSR